MITKTKTKCVTFSGLNNVNMGSQEKYLTKVETKNVVTIILSQCA